MSLPALVLQCCHPANTILNYRQERCLSWAGNKALQLWMCNQHTYKHACMDRLAHKERKWAMQRPPLLFPSAHIHCDSSLCSRIAVRGTNPKLTSLTSCLLSFIPCDPANLKVTAGECYCWNISMKKGLWKARGGWWCCGINGRLQEREWRKGKEATNCFVGRGFVWLPEKNAILWDADIKACVCMRVWVCVCGSQFKALCFELAPSWIKVSLNESLLEASVILRHSYDVIY